MKKCCFISLWIILAMALVFPPLAVAGIVTALPGILPDMRISTGMEAPTFSGETRQPGKWLYGI